MEMMDMIIGWRLSIENMMEMMELMTFNDSKLITNRTETKSRQ
jgi:hypothetical protein